MEKEKIEKTKNALACFIICSILRVAENEKSEYVSADEIQVLHEVFNTFIALTKAYPF